MTTQLNGTAPLPVRDTTGDRGAALVDELDDLIAALDEALANQTAARLVIADAELEMSIIEASVTLTVEGRNETERKARLTLALAEDAGYRTHAQAARDARLAMWEAERAIAVVKQRIGLVRAALALLADGKDGAA